jgi:hypothetical protein
MERSGTVNGQERSGTVNANERRLAPKVNFLRKSQVKSPKSQVMTLTFLKKTKKVKVMTLTFSCFESK